jgi:transcriptional regulator with XRE-family HTH domain
VNKKIGERIRRIRVIKNYSQANVAEDLGMTTGAYAKIERGETDANISRLFGIAEALEVNITEFFEDPRPPQLMENPNPYGFATKDEVQNLSRSIQTLLSEFEKLKMELQNVPAKKRKPVAAKKSSRK